MKKYETVVVFTTTLGESELNDEIQKVQDLIQNNGGREISPQKWGRKEIAYTVKKQKFGHYVSFNFTSEESSCVERVSRLLDITDSVLKFQTHSVTDKRRKFKGYTKAKPSTEGGDETEELSESEY